VHLAVRLKSVVLPNSLKHIGEDAFWGCTSLMRVTMPVVRPIVGRNAFKGCRWSEPA
jgi:hypothetical protein